MLMGWSSRMRWCGFRCRAITSLLRDVVFHIVGGAPSPDFPLKGGAIAYGRYEKRRGSRRGAEEKERREAVVKY
ncbi:MAG: hypothetical protein RLY97_957 [Pseudomonadota bacterium]|jgi:hypothetical protein